MSRNPIGRDAALFQRLAAETDESASVRLFVDLCRGSPALRHWLWEDFARDAAKRERFAQLIDKPVPDVARFADLDGESDLWRKEAERLRAQLPRRPYGGCSFQEIKERLIRHQAGKADSAAFLFAIEWQRLRTKGISPRLLRGAFEVLDAAMNSPTGFLARQLEEARMLAQEFAAGGCRAALGFADWWKVNVLLHILRHPAPSYRTRELQAYLASRGLKVTARDIRRFCGEVGIKRDMRAGRPGKAPASAQSTAATRRRTSARTTGR